MRKAGVILFGLCPWLILGAVCVRGISPSYAPRSLEARVAFFHQHREEFDSYITRLEHDEVQKNEFSYALPQLFIDNNMTQVVRNGDCFLLYFWFLPPTDSVPLYIYSPRGLDGVPEEYRNGGYSGGRKWTYWKFVTIDDKWFYCEWDM